MAGQHRASPGTLGTDSTAQLKGKSNLASNPHFVGFESINSREPTMPRAPGSGALATEVRRLLGIISATGIKSSSLLSVDVFSVEGEDSQWHEAMKRELGKLLPDDARPVVSVVPAKQLLGSPVRLQAIAVPQESTRDFSQNRFPEAAVAGKYFAAASELRTLGSITEQSEAALSSLRLKVEEFGASFADVINFGVYFVDGGTREEWMEAALMRAASFEEPGPCATGISLHSMAGAGALIQFEMFGIEGARRLGQIVDAWPDEPWEWPFRLPYRQGNRVNRLCIVGGQSARGSDMKISAPTDLSLQTTTTMEKIDSVLTELGGTLKDVVRLSAHYVAQDDRDGAVVRDRIIAAMPQTRFDLSLIGVLKLAHPEMLVEIDGQALINE